MPKNKNKKKKSSSSTTPLKKPLEAGDKPAIQETKQVPKPGKLGQEIDDIFAGRNKKKKKKKPELEIPDNKDTKVEIAKLMKKRKRNELDNGFNNNSKRRPRKRTVEGFPVYTEDELCVNKLNAGDTPLCPFDCNCCF